MKRLIALILWIAFCGVASGQLISGPQAATPIPLTYLDTDPTAAANSDAKVMSQAAVVDYVTANAGVSNGQVILDNSSVIAANFGTRQLIAPSGEITATVLDWSNPASLVLFGTLAINSDGTLSGIATSTLVNGSNNFGFSSGKWKPILSNDPLSSRDGNTYLDNSGFHGDASALTNLPVGSASAQYAAGTVYTMTASDALIDFGTTDPIVGIPQAGTYLIMGRAYLKYNGATYASTQTATVHLRRTNNTAADIANATTTATMRVITTITDSVGIMSLPPVIYTTANNNDFIAVYGSLSATPAAGSVQCAEASIIAIRLF